MSEFEKQDQEEMGLVNKGERTAAASATDEADRQGSRSIHKARGKGKYLAPDPEADEKAELQRRWLLSGIKITVCAGGIAMLVGILKEPELVPAVVNFGVACFVGVAAVILDRTVKRL